MGQVYYDMGFLSSTEVIERSASDLVGQYVGHTGPKTKALLEKALGRVLFIDEAYRLSEGQFAKEAMDELVGLLTQETFRGKLLVVIAGYNQEMNRLLSVNPGLASRFPDDIVFENLSSTQCLDILNLKLSKQSIHLEALDKPTSHEYVQMAHLLEDLAQLPSWGNARDIETLSKRLMCTAFTTPLSANDATPSERLVLARSEGVRCLEEMLREQKERAVPESPFNILGDMQEISAHPPQPHTFRTSTTLKKETSAPRPVDANATQVENVEDVRDAGVSDAVWRELQKSKIAADEAERQSKEAEKTLLAELLELERRQAEAQAQATRLAQQNFANAAEEDELMRQRELARLRAHSAKLEHSKRAAALEEERKKQKDEARVQSKLRQMGVCVAGFRWIKLDSGYSCAGGGHFVSNAQLGV